MIEPTEQRIEVAARIGLGWQDSSLDDLVAQLKRGEGSRYQLERWHIARGSARAALTTDTPALAAEYERGKEYGLREARRIAQLMSDNLEEDNPALDHVIAVIDARLSAKEGLK